MNINWQTISKETFLKDYWQKKPILLKNALPNFPSPIAPDEVAGLAMESFIDSRVITNSDNNWKVAQGPFEDFSQFGERCWSLLVQGVDNWFDSVDELKSMVNFIPKWRIDDVMISFSTPGGGVGPHFDQYDVFIVQGIGKRQWQVGAVNKEIEHIEAATDLLHVPAFEPIIDATVTNGDILYIPPFSPHQGETIESALAYSIGFRAPSSQELLSGIADHIIDQNLGLDRFTDTVINNDTSGFGLSPANITQLQKQVLDLVGDKAQFEHYLLTRLTAATRELNVEPLAERIPADYGNELFNSEIEIQKVLGVKLAISSDEENLTLFCDGENYPLSSQQVEFANKLISCSSSETLILKKHDFCIENSQLITTLINYGYFFILDEHELQG
ncbi:cupin domain-containing protein [Psychrosphaera sp. B3R10]|uniref:cupin domain-containing protein n=1 Tax=unclassified Psychrosphaera TaxID=2641570 RepID=UPI001C0A0199|nr:MULTISPECIES: cupin domain-containing protein [unclassified Psychrosphaera]MBU2881236.1 cupin domain-containing protein [Psychrosphaera sp. I2R16]MBU2988335.1 cupin domain-containing protein [Psychrosphaera sp. B3R10]MDO6720169.1 cupin domain-containing protein [Psychrosphaera sp. 1_MG-2023]